MQKDLESLDKKDIISKLLENITAIKNLEEDNLKLKTLIIEKQKLDDDSLREKINVLLAILSKKQQDLKNLKQKISDDFRKISLHFEKKLEEEKEKSKHLGDAMNRIRILEAEYSALKKRHVKTKFILKKEFEKKLQQVNDDFKIYSRNHKDILKAHEEKKLGLKKDLEVRKQRFKELFYKHEKLKESHKNMIKENILLHDKNKELLKRIQYLEEHGLANDKRYQAKLDFLRKQLEDKVKEITKQFIEKEVEYKSVIESLKKDLMKYMEELSETKKKYFHREKELRNKLKRLTTFLD